MKVLLRSVCIEPETSGDFEFSNPASDSGSTRIGMSVQRTSVKLLAVSPRAGFPEEYPTGEGYRVILPVESVPTLVAWGLIQFKTTEPDGTDVRARLHDGADQYWFTAGAWALVSDEDADWNTLQEVKENLISWEPTDLGLVFELSTTDRFKTPELFGFKFTYEIDLVSEFNDWIYGSLVGPMQDLLRPLHDIIVTSDGLSTFDFGELKSSTEDSWSLTEPTAIYNETTDPNHRANILSSYDSGTGVAVLSSAPTSGQKLLIRSKYAPVIAVTTDIDYTELGAVPAVLFERIRVVDIASAPASNSIVDVFVEPPTGIIFPPARRCTISIDLTLWAPLAVDRGRLWEEVTTFLRKRPVLVSPNTGEKCSLQIIDPGLQADGPVDRDGLRDGTMSFRLWDVYFNHLPPLVAGDGQPGSESAFGVSVVQAGVQVGDTTVTVDVEGS